jgi:two-component system chemotaxis response regulator CheY
MFKPSTKILVVDDMMTMRKIIIKNLKDMGFSNFTEADDGAAAWPKIQEAHGINQPFELILCDWNMPVLKGIQLLGNCRTDPRFKDVPFVLITAESEKSQVMEALKLGVSNYIVKPFTLEQLKEKLTLVYKKHFAASAVSV